MRQDSLTACQVALTLAAMTAKPVRVTIDVPNSHDDPLAVISAIVDSTLGIELSLRTWVRKARSKGHSWQEVADALRVSRQAAWERFRDVVPAREAASDPAFASAVERAYLRELARLRVGKSLNLGATHKDLLASAIYGADRSNGGLRFKRLGERSELEARLMRALSSRLTDP